MVETCDEILAYGVCHRTACALSHDVHTCQICRTVYLTSQEYETHLVGALHRRRAYQDTRRKAGLSQTVLCTICSVELSSVTLYGQHIGGRRHQRELQAKGVRDDPGPEAVDVPRGHTRCEICSTNIPDRLWSKHIANVRHTKAMQFTSLQGALEDSEADKNGLEITPQLVDYGIIDDAQVSATSVIRKTIDILSTTATPIWLLDVRMASSHQSRGVPSNFRVNHAGRKQLKSGNSISLAVEFTSKGVQGRFQDRIELVFEDSKLKTRFAITRVVTAIVGQREDYELLKPTRPYVRPKQEPQEPISSITPGVAPPSIATFTWAVKLLPYLPPERLLKLAYEDSNLPPAQIAARIRSAFLSGTLDVNSYARFFQTMLWIEEERAKRDLSQYDIDDTTLIPSGKKFYELEVSGLAEKRPSVIVTDRIFVKHYGSAVNHWWEGHVHVVKEKSVVLQFHGKFNAFKGQRFHVRFALNRLVYRRMHQGLTTAFKEARILFPDARHLGAVSRPTKSQLKNIHTTDRKIMDNPPQLEAVAAILNRPSGSVPFVVFGPPGTGKTVTIVEAIRQLVQTRQDAYILACAPSNSAADLIAERLAGLGKNQLFRLNAHSRGVNNISRTVLDLSRMTKDENGMQRFEVPPRDELMRFRVIVCTCLSASLPHGVGVPRGHYSHIFIDEAGQATEPEVMISIKTLADLDTNVILSGDSKQLGPIVRSPIARDLGLTQSYLDRLMGNAIYDEQTGRGITLCKLTKNWRSHPTILKFPNDEFYRGDLEACGDPVIINSLLRWDSLVKQDFPLIFHGIAGKDEREASSPSFFNIGEASLVKKYVMDLLGDRRLRLRPEHIGVISPYNAQVQKIRKLLTEIKVVSDLKNVKVGSVEEYQGQEKRVIIISTVRSSIDFVKFDLRHTLGFVANPRRFNVAITRAQALLIVIGDPAVLSLDPLWRSFINYIHNSGGCTGKRIDWDPKEEVNRFGEYDKAARAKAMSDLDDLITRTKIEVLEHTEDLGGHEGDVLEGNFDQPWREDE